MCFFRFFLSFFLLLMRRSTTQPTNALSSALVRFVCPSPSLALSLLLLLLAGCDKAFMHRHIDSQHMASQHNRQVFMSNEFH